MVMEGVWSSHTEAALPILGSIVTRQYLRAAKAWRVHGKGRGSTCPQSSPQQKSTRVVQSSRELVKTHFFLKILKQQIMVRTISTLFQTMMRCYSSLRAGRAHILSGTSAAGYFPHPGLALRYIWNTWLSGEVNGKRVNSRKYLTEWDG